MIELRTLGGAGLTRPDGVEVRSVLVQPKRFALLLHLALELPLRFHRRDVLLALLWPAADAERARASLRTSLHFLRRSLGEGVIESRGDEVGLAADAVRSDVSDFQAALESGRLEAALELYRGPLLPGFAVDDSPAWNDWLDRERARLARVAAEAAWTLSERNAASPADAVTWARRALEIVPDEERSVRRLMELLDGAGDRAGALQVYADFERRMASEFDSSPSPETRRTAAGIQARTLAGSALASPEPAEVATWPAAPPARAEPRGATLAPSPSRRPSRLRLLSLAGLAAAGLIALVSARFTGRAEARHFDPTGGIERVVVLPFAVRGAADLAFLGDGMVDLLGAKLDGAGELRSADPRAVLAASPDRTAPLAPGDGASIASGLGARYYVLGALIATGDRLQLTASLYDRLRPDEPPVLGQADGAADDVFGAVDALAAELIARRATGLADRLERIAARTTHSLPALKLYLQGTRALRQGDFDRAAELLQGAVAEDTTFALAAYQLANALDGAGRAWPRDYTPLELASRHARRLSEHDRSLIEARAAYYQNPGGPHRSEALYREILAQHPTDVDAWYQLGDILFHHSPARGRSFTLARAPMQRALVLDPGHLAALQHLARIEAWDENLPALDTLTARGVALAAEGDQLLELLALRALALDDGEARRRLIAGLERAGDPSARYAVLRSLTYSRRFDEAAALVAPLLAPARSAAVRAMAHAMRADIALAMGRPRAALRELDAADGVEPGNATIQRIALLTLPLTSGGAPALAASGPPASDGLLRGLRAVCAGEFDRALAEADALDHTGGDGDVLRIHVSWAGGPVAPERALEMLDGRVHPSFPRGYFRLMRADILARLGRHEEAIEWLSSVPDDLDFGGIVHFAPAELRIAQSLEALGRPGQAALHYARFVRMWKHAEPELRPVVRRAERRLQQLADSDD